MRLKDDVRAVLMFYWICGGQCCYAWVRFVRIATYC